MMAILILENRWYKPFSVYDISVYDTVMDKGPMLK